MHGPSGSHAEKKLEFGNVSYKACTRTPTILPNEAPIAMEGTKIPAGTLHPYETMTNNVRMTVAAAKVNTRCHRCLRLWIISKANQYRVRAVHSLADLVIIMGSFTFSEENLHALGHIDPQEHIWVTNNGSDKSQNRCFPDWVLREILLTEGLDAQVPFDYKRTVEPTKNTKDDVKDDFKEVPVTVILDLEHDQLTGSERIHCLISSVFLL